MCHLNCVPYTLMVVTLCFLIMKFVHIMQLFMDITRQKSLHLEIFLFPGKSFKCSSDGNTVDSELLFAIHFRGQREPFSAFRPTIMHNFSEKK